MQTGNPKIKFVEVASPGSIDTQEYQRALSDYTGTLTEDAVGEENQKISIIDDARQPKPILKSNSDI